MIQLIGNEFQSGTFDGAKQMKLLVGGSVGYIDEAIFKPFLADNSNLIFFYRDQFRGIKSYIDCLDCKNYWLINGSKDAQVFYAFCKHNATYTLFNVKIKNELKLKCK